MTFRCVPCVTPWRDADGATKYVAEIRYAGVAGSDAQLGNSKLYADREQAFEALVIKVRRLPELLKEFEVVVGKQVFQDIELAAQSIASTRPMSDDVPIQRQAAKTLSR
jgi:hypothetical protein